jgi:hypothetical protein
MTETQLELRARAVGPWPMNTYVLVCPATRQSVLIDPGAEPDTLREMLKETQPVAFFSPIPTMTISARWTRCAPPSTCPSWRTPGRTLGD